MIQGGTQLAYFIIQCVGSAMEILHEIPEGFPNSFLREELTFIGLCKMSALH